MPRLLILILLLSAVLRLWSLPRFPAGLNADEAALGYNAYSLVQTGRDEHGHILPVNLESFGDFKPALYAYLLVPLVKVFGLTEFVVRLPSALLGVAAVLLLYYLARLVLPGSRNPALIAALFLAVSPWHLHYSRGGWEVNLATTLLLLGTIAFLRWRATIRLWPLLLFTIYFSLSLYAYQSARVIAPAIALGLILFSLRDLLSNRRQVFNNFILGVLLLLPIAYTLITTNAASRFSGVGFLADLGPLNRVKEFRGQHNPPQSAISRALHNRPVIYTLQFLGNYLSHFDGNFLFVNGDVIGRNRVPETGLLYLTDFILIGAGIIFLLRFPRRDSRIIWLWLLVAPVASALTFQVPHALRAFPLVVPLTLLSASGIYYLLSRAGRYYRLLLLLILVLYSYQFTRYLHEYYVHYPREYPAVWEYGFDQLVGFVKGVENQYDRVIVTDKYDQPYILFLFYSRFSPEKFQTGHELTVRDQYNFSTVRQYDKYTFTSTPWEKVRDIHNSLIVAAPEDIPLTGVNIIKTIYFPGGEPAFKIISN